MVEHSRTSDGNRATFSAVLASGRDAVGVDDHGLVSRHDSAGTHTAASWTSRRDSTVGRPSHSTGADYPMTGLVATGKLATT